MPVVFRNPNLPDYFLEMPADGCVIDAYEDAKVIVLKERPVIDFSFWANLPVDTYPRLKKVSGMADDPATFAKSLTKAGLPSDLQSRLQQAAASLLEQLIPWHARVFAGYRFTRKKFVFRLNTTLNENMHVDAYKEPSFDHFARMFVNLDEQPRIWHTSWPLKKLYEEFGASALKTVGAERTPSELHAAVNAAAFGADINVWYDTQPRHVIYFNPGDVWLVDSRQISHQIFYGRRALSIDFLVDPTSMHQPSNHYLRIAESRMTGTPSTAVV